MASTDAYALQRSDLNGFLFADVGVEANGTTLSVLSTLARLGMDPWQEAGRLAKLPRTAAVDELARIIATMPASLWPLPDATATAARLVALLPARGGGLSVAPSAQPADAATFAARLLALLPARGDGPSITRSTQPVPATPRTTRRWSVVLLVLWMVLTGLTLNLAGQRGAASESDAATRGAASQAASPATPPGGHTPTDE